MFDRFTKIYAEAGVLDVSGQRFQGKPLHRACSDASACWEGRSQGKSLDSWNQVQFPWVGPFYWGRPRRVGILGLNLNEYGGLLSLHELVLAAQAALLNGHRRVHFGNPRYRGTLLWHRAASYACLLGEIGWVLHDGEVWLGSERLEACAAALADVWNGVCFLESIKCSPEGDRSRPTQTMRSRCPGRFLRKELEILSPHDLLVLGRETLGALSGFLPDLDKPEVETPGGKAAVFRSELGGHVLRVVAVTHPSSPGGASGTIISELATILSKGGAS